MTEFFTLPSAEDPREAIPIANYVSPGIGGELMAEGQEVVHLPSLDEAGRDALRQLTRTKGHVGQQPSVEISSPTIDVGVWRNSSIGQIPIGVTTLRGARRRSKEMPATDWT
jgi:hypothetical protein